MLWLIEEDLEKWDEHWMPVSLRCRQNYLTLSCSNLSIRVCQLPFRYVIKYENLAEEWPHLLHRLTV